MLRVIFLKFCREVFLGCSRLNEKLVLAIVISCVRQYLLPKVFFNDHEVIFTLFDLIGIYIRLFVTMLVDILVSLIPCWMVKRKMRSFKQLMNLQG